MPAGSSRRIKGSIKSHWIINGEKIGRLRLNKMGILLVGESDSWTSKGISLRFRKTGWIRRDTC